MVGIIACKAYTSNIKNQIKIEETLCYKKKVLYLQIISKKE